MLTCACRRAQPAGGVDQRGQTFVTSPELINPTDASASGFYLANPYNRVSAGSSQAGAEPGTCGQSLPCQRWIPQLVSQPRAPPAGEIIDSFAPGAGDQQLGLGRLLRFLLPCAASAGGSLSQGGHRALLQAAAALRGQRGALVELPMAERR
jgi:hypothetical protein